ncbi:glutamine synthetase [Maritalea mediterranea]|uniref:Glutamine synthetase n=1 Tax=Maritalea mediterranea TaxID=2909667 RepID=A0ABS9E652_9HYPH|nr:glutamine synthetase [Maritalea mediterranea]MCF4098263.1 glutamine synthetase [Maritalea mediterranea]
MSAIIFKQQGYHMVDKQKWVHQLPSAALDWLEGRWVEEVECIVRDIVGISRGKTMPAEKFSADALFYLPTSIFYQSITWACTNRIIKVQRMETDIGHNGINHEANSMKAVDEYGDVINDICNFAEARGLEIDMLDQKGGVGQIEINLQHGDPPKLTDEVFYFKRSIRDGCAQNQVPCHFAGSKELRSSLGEVFCLVYEAIKPQKLDEFLGEISPWEREHLLLNM